MDAALKKILKIDKTNWIPLKFGDVVFEPKENAKDIYNEEIEHVVGLEHIDSENIHLTRSGILEETTTFSKKFAKGDMLFGRRRAYLKKAALASFDGICSGDITVFRAKKNILPELLPFIVNNEKFFDHAIKHSAGGLSPRVKFKDLANYEFLLPPKDQQAQLAELLWAMDEVIESEKGVFNQIQALEESYRSSEIDNLNAEEIKLDELVLPMSKINVGKIDKSKYQNIGKYPIIDQSKDFIIGYTDDSSLVYNGDLPVLVFGDHTTIIKYIDFPFVMGADGTKVIKPNCDLDVYYLYHAIKRINIKPQGYRRHFSVLKNKTIKVPREPKWIADFNSKMHEILKSAVATDSKISTSKVLQKSIINQVF